MALCVKTPISLAKDWHFGYGLGVVTPSEMLETVKDAGLPPVPEGEKVTDGDLAAYLGVDPTTLSRWNQGHAQPRGANLKRLQAEYEVARRSLKDANKSNEQLLEDIMNRVKLLDRRHLLNTARFVKGELFDQDYAGTEFVRAHTQIEPLVEIEEDAP